MVVGVYLSDDICQYRSEYAAALFIRTDESLHDADEYLDLERWIGGTIINIIPGLVGSNCQEMAAKFVGWAVPTNHQY